MLRIFTGPMFSGKTTRLIESIKSNSADFDVRIVAKWVGDLRSGCSKTIRTHSGKELSLDVQAFQTLDEVNVLQPQQNERMLIAVDEAHFFEEDLLRLWRRVQHRNRGRKSGRRDLLLISGLDLDFRRERFGHVLDLIQLTEEERENQRDEDDIIVERLSARCFQCGEPAEYSMRTHASEEQVLVGGGDMYQPSCLHHHRIPALLAQSSAS